jgi:hypothetical protein
MTRTSTIVIVTLAALAATSFSTTASARGGFSGGGFGGGGFGGGGHSFGGPISTTGGFAHVPVAAGGIARSSIVPRLVGSANTGGHTNIPTTTAISQFPKGPVTPPPPPAGNNSKSGSGWGGRGGFAGVVSVDVAADNDCLVKQYLPNGRVLFRDVCTRETALSR